MTLSHHTMQYFTAILTNYSHITGVSKEKQSIEMFIQEPQHLSSSILQIGWVIF